MFRNYLKIAWRSLTRNKAFSFTNIMGLALGMTCSLLIILWVQDERSVDAFHANSKRLYQVYERQYYDGKVDAIYNTQGLLASELKRVVPEVEYATGLEYAAQPGTQNNFEAGERVNKMEGNYAGEDFFKMFSYPIIAGNADQALNSPVSIAISRKMAEFFFGSAEQAILKTIRFENAEDLQVTAVFENLPPNVSRKFDFLRSWSAFVKQNSWTSNWGNSSPDCIIQLRNGANAADVENKIKDFIYRYKEKDQAARIELALQPFSERYLHSTFKNGYIDGGRIEYVRLFTWVALFILLIACINFMNLATAQSAKRAKEVGLRKVIGAGRSSLIMQFIGEAILLTFISVIIAVVATTLLIPGFNGLTGKHLSLPVSTPIFWMALFALMIITGFVAGSYPALFLSSLKPVKVLKGGLKFSWRSAFFRQGLVVFQFAMSIILILGMIVIYRQVDYIQNKNLGYDRDNLVYIPIEGELIKGYEVFKQEAGKLPGILSISKMRNSPTVIEHHTNGIGWPGKDPNLQVSFADGVVGYDFAKTMKLTVKEGRDFSKEYPSDSAGFLLNETAVKKMGIDNPVGKRISWGDRQGEIVGVLKDFHFSSMHQAIDPLIIRNDERWTWGNILVRTKEGRTKEAIAGLEKLCRSINPKFPFTYRFSDQEFTKLYQSEQIVSKLSGYFAFLAIFISCLGLFGLATFTAEQRIKEIGVRKVLGASASSIVGLLSGSFLRLVVLALVIAFPLSWVMMNNWLQDFAYKVNLEWWMFVAAGVLTICIALLTVSYQSIRAALMNPVKNLRTE